VRKLVVACEGDRRLCLRSGRPCLAAEAMHPASKVQCEGHTIGMRQLLGSGQRLTDTRHSLVRIAKYDQAQGKMAQARYHEVLGAS